MASRWHSPLIGQTWHHASSPLPIDTAPPNSKGFSPPGNSKSLLPSGESSWSGDWKNLFADSNTANSSDWHGQSAASTASWSDELENESTQKLSEQYEQIESALYGDSSEEQLSNPNVALECKQWKERFPHLRAIGVGIRGVISSDSSSTEPNDQEEVIAADGNYEDVSQSHSPVSNEVEVYSHVFEITRDDVEKYKEKVKKTVLDQIFSKIWPNIIKKIDPVFKKILERNKLAVQPTPKICLENNVIQPSSELMFSNNDKYLRVSPEPLRETSAKKSSFCATSPVPLVKPSVRECSAQQKSSLNMMNSPSVLKSAVNSLSAVKLSQPPPVVFPSAEKLLGSPMPSEARNILQSARIRKKLSPKNTSAKIKLSPKNTADQEREDGRGTTQFTVKKSARGYWNRHGMLPPISSKENIKTLSATQRSTSALQNLGKADLELRPNTSLPNKSGISLRPLNDGNKKKSRIELAQEWLEKQLTAANNSKHRLSTHADTASRWRAHHLSHRK